MRPGPGLAFSSPSTSCSTRPSCALEVPLSLLPPLAPVQASSPSFYSLHNRSQEHNCDTPHRTARPQKNKVRLKFRSPSPRHSHGRALLRSRTELTDIWKVGAEVSGFSLSSVSSVHGVSFDGDPMEFGGPNCSCSPVAVVRVGVGTEPGREL
jgi:hypothetical protein